MLQNANNGGSLSRQFSRMLARACGFCFALCCYSVAFFERSMHRIVRALSSVYTLMTREPARAGRKASENKTHRVPPVPVVRCAPTLCDIGGQVRIDMSHNKRPTTIRSTPMVDKFLLKSNQSALDAAQTLQAKYDGKVRECEQLRDDTERWHLKFLEVVRKHNESIRNCTERTSQCEARLESMSEELAQQTFLAREWEGKYVQADKDLANVVGSQLIVVSDLGIVGGRHAAELAKPSEKEVKQWEARAKAAEEQFLQWEAKSKDLEARCLELKQEAQQHADKLEVKVQPHQELLMQTGGVSHNLLNLDTDFPDAQHVGDQYTKLMDEDRTRVLEHWEEMRPTTTDNQQYGDGEEALLMSCLIFASREVVESRFAAHMHNMETTLYASSKEDNKKEPKSSGRQLLIAMLRLRHNEHTRDAVLKKDVHTVWQEALNSFHAITYTHRQFDWDDSLQPFILQLLRVGWSAFLSAPCIEYVSFVTPTPDQVKYSSERYPIRIINEQVDDKWRRNTPYVPVLLYPGLRQAGGKFLCKAEACEMEVVLVM